MSMQTAVMMFNRFGAVIKITKDLGWLAIVYYTSTLPFLFIFNQPDNYITYENTLGANLEISSICCLSNLLSVKRLLKLDFFH